jgi:inner membrane protein
VTSRTHDLAAFSAINAVFLTQTTPNLSFSTTLVSIGFCFIGGLTPDIDSPTSEFWQKIPAGTFIGSLLHPLIGGHRLISHSLLGLVLIGWGIQYILGWMGKVLLVDINIVWWAFMIGFVSHLIMDSFTKEGIPLLFPLPIKFGIPPVKFLRVETGSNFEKYLVFPLLLGLDIYLIYHYYPFYLNFLRRLIS